MSVDQQLSFVAILEDAVDKFNQAIIAQLRKNARISVSTIAQEVNLSRSAVSERINKLEKTGVIRGYQVMLSESEKSAISIYFEIQHRRRHCNEIVEIFRAIPEVVSCSSITGDMDLLVLVKADSMQRIHKIREQLDIEPDITKVKTHVVLSEWINNSLS